MWLVYLAFGAFVCFCSCTAEHKNNVANQDGNIDIIEELRFLRKMVVENRMLITKQETELKAVKHELEETKRNCLGGSTSDGKKTTPNEIGAPQRNTTVTLIRKGKFQYTFFLYMCVTIRNYENSFTMIEIICRHIICYPFHIKCT